MGLLSDTAEWFTSRKTPIQRWYKDDEGRYGFRVTVEGEAFVVAALSQRHKTGDISVMEKLVRRAEDTDAMLLLRIGDERRVYDPDTFRRKRKTGVINDERAKRGERWLHVPADWGVDFRAYVDGDAHPDDTHGDLRDFGVEV